MRPGAGRGINGPPPTDPERHAVDLLARRFTGSALDLDPAGDEGPFDGEPATPKGPPRNPVLERIRAELRAKKAAEAAAANADADGETTPDAAKQDDGDAEAIADAWEAALGTNKPDAEPANKQRPKPDDNGTG